MELPECAGCRERDNRIAQLEARVLELEATVRDLNDHLKKLTHPPKPPAAAPKLPPGPAKKPSGRKRGGQKGHPPHLKKRLPPEQITEVIPFVPKRCQRCEAHLPKEAGPHDPEPSWHQVAELPEMAARITEYQGHYRTCPCCGEVAHASIPAEIQAHSFGPRFTATLSYMAGSLGQSKRNIEEFSEVVFAVPIALGTIANLEQEMSAALAAAHQEALKVVEEAPIKHADETGWKQNGKKRWLWVGATTSIVAFIISPWRNVVALKRLLGEKLQGILCSDRWTVYDVWEPIRRQLCWAHLKRNWEKKAERGGTAQKLAKAWLEVQKQVFELWHLFRGGGLTRRQLGDQMGPWMLKVTEILQCGSRSRNRKLARFCQRLMKVQTSLWTFVVEEGVEPTNNHAERVQRRAVLWRKRSFGCHSLAGCRFVERILTVVQTLRLQGRSTLGFLEESIRAHRTGKKAPQLILEG
jgi:transposase